jgi:PPOX class probable F420-dependent enzyme
MVVETYAFTGLDEDKYISLKTFRRSGEAVSTPMWFAQSKGTVYAETGVSAGKLKRIRHTERVTLAVCTLSGRVTGAEMEGRARILSEPEEVKEAEAAMSKKYRLTRSMYYFVLSAISALRRKPHMNLVYIAIESVTV